MNRLLVTGSRRWTDERFLRAVLNAAFRERPDKTASFTLVHGHNRHGADALANRWARDYACVGWRPILVERHPAEWRIHGKAAGPLRNQTMVDRGAYKCLAFISPCTSWACPRSEPHGSHGATDCAERAQAAGIPTVIHRPPLGGVA